MGNSLKSWNRLRGQTLAGCMKIVRGLTREAAAELVEEKMPDEEYDAATELLDRIGAWHQPNRLEAQIAYGPGSGATKGALVAAAIVMKSLE